MSELFETLITLVPIALFIAIRILSVKKKQEANSQGRKEMVSTLASKLKRPVREIVSSGHWEEDSDEDEHVPYSLANGTETYGMGMAPPGAIPLRQPPKKIEPVIAEVLPDIRGLTEKTAPKADQTDGGPGGIHPKPLGFPEKLEYLPPLKRAVVMMEVLGPPKGI